MRCMPAAASRPRCAAGQPGARRGPAAATVVVRALLLSMALLLGPLAGPAVAHDVLVGSTPAADSTQATAPDRVVLEFSGAPQPLGLEVAVAGPAGSTVTDGAPTIEGTTVVQRLRGDLAAGSYTVDWRVVSGDGHPLSGTITFTLSQDAGAAAGADEGPAAAPADGDQLATASGASTFPVVWLAVAAVAVVAGAVVVRQLRRPA